MSPLSGRSLFCQQLQKDLFFLLRCCAHHDDSDSLGWMTSLCIKCYTPKKGKYLVAQTANKQQNRPKQQTQKPKQEPRYSPWCETVKLALSDVNPALSTSLPTNSSTELSTPLDYVPLVLTIGACDDGPSLLRLFAALPSLRLSCSLASWYVTSMAISSLLMISKMCCTTASSSTNQITPAWVALASISFLECSHVFHACQCDVGKTESWTSSPGRHGRLRISNFSSRPARWPDPRLMF